MVVTVVITHSIIWIKMIAPIVMIISRPEPFHEYLVEFVLALAVVY